MALIHQGPLEFTYNAYNRPIFDKEVIDLMLADAASASKDL
jgi:hypothetical protein